MWKGARRPVRLLCVFASSCESNFLNLSPRRDVLRRENLAAADTREAEEAQQAFLFIGRALGARLHLDDLALAGQHDIARTEARRVGKECGRTGRPRCAPIL